MKDLPLVLVVEDNEAEALFILRSLDSAGVKNPIRVVNDGEEFVVYMEGRGKYDDRRMYPLPGLVLLNLKLPKRDCFELLSWVRGHAKFSGVQMIVLTGTQDLRDICRAYQAGANSFLRKPMDNRGLSEAINGFWLGVAKTPAVSESRSQRNGK